MLICLHLEVLLLSFILVLADFNLNLTSVCSGCINDHSATSKRETLKATRPIFTSANNILKVKSLLRHPCFFVNRCYISYVRQPVCADGVIVLMKLQSLGRQNKPYVDSVAFPQDGRHASVRLLSTSLTQIIFKLSSMFPRCPRRPLSSLTSWVPTMSPWVPTMSAADLQNMEQNHRAHPYLAACLWVPPALSLPSPVPALLCSSRFPQRPKESWPKGLDSEESWDILTNIQVSASIYY